MITIYWKNKMMERVGPLAINGNELFPVSPRVGRWWVGMENPLSSSTRYIDLFVFAFLSPTKH